MKESLSQKGKWIKTGYRHFANFGPQELSIKSIAQDAGVSRTTFYHFFADMDDYIGQLLEYHQEVAEEHFMRLRLCKTYEPDVFKVVIDFREEIFFHRQLLLHKENPIFFQTYQMLNQRSNEIIYPLWAEYFQYNGDEARGKEIHLMLLDLWYLEMNENDFTYEDFLRNSQEIKNYLQAFARAYKLPKVKVQ
jgi:AcrR family transcriptional regulator